jgi:predicted neuraminidase
MTTVSRKLLFAALWLATFSAVAYKMAHRPPPTAFAVPTVRAAHVVNAPEASPKARLAGPESEPSLKAQFVSSVPGQAVHAASVVELLDGSLRAVWFSGSREGAGDVTIQTAVWDKARDQWGPEFSLFDRVQLQRGLQRYVKKIGNPVIARAPDGSLNLWMVNVSLGGWAGSAITWSRSVDEGATWGMPKRLVTSPFLNISTLVKGPPAAMMHGQISLPVYHEFITKFAEVLRLDANGRVVDKVRMRGSQTSLQPVVLVSGAQTAQAFMRATQGGKVVSSTTQDAGQTWSVAAPIAEPNPNAALAGVVLQDGSRWLALNPTRVGREKLALIKLGDPAATEIAVEPAAQNKALANAPSAALSVSDHAAALGAELKSTGATEPQIAAYIASAQKQLCNATQCAQEFSYPFLLQSRDGTLHLVYSWHRSRIKHVQFDLSGLLAAGSGS